MTWKQTNSLPNPNDDLFQSKDHPCIEDSHVWEFDGTSWKGKLRFTLLLFRSPPAISAGPLCALWRHDESDLAVKELAGAVDGRRSTHNG